ncbi:MAG TPA: response regulator [Candidatus Dormibacteraeota bacterium]|nr:response regulator [Candidatus Dormibacteraeota bacterium]
MAKILVADDNSNIQKMVGLALKDQGIDVVAVGNGEAAVRKISEIRPDLVLADVFMPVRNGYEVCEYVKKDPSLAHIPVILLVGAFDPLDEQEAQRVGADGVLKKPFVPPDPLISTVKAALTRAGVKISADSKDKVTETPPKRAADLLPPRSGSAMPPPPMPSAPAAMLETESVVEEAPVKPADFTIAAGDKTLAFGNLLDTPGLTEELDDSAYVTAKPTEFETERNWGTETDEPEEELEIQEEDDEVPADLSWRRDAAEVSSEPISSTREWKNTSLQEINAQNGHDLSVVPAGEKSPDETADIVPMLEPKPLPSFTGDAWAAAISAGTQDKIAAEKSEAAPDITHESSAPVPAPAADDSTAQAEQHASKSDSWVSRLTNPWVNGTASKELAWDVPAVAPPAEPPAAPPAINVQADDEPIAEDKLPETVETSQFISGDTLIESEPPAGSHYAAESILESSDEVVEQAGSLTQLPSETVHLLQEEVHAAVVSQQEEIAATHSQPSEESVSEDVSYETSPVSGLSAELNAATAEPADAAVQESVPEEKQVPSAPESEVAKMPEVDMEALVARVLSRMSPEALQAVTREILKPVLETIIRDEINAKKS